VTETEQVEFEQALTRQCAACYAPEGKLCNHAVIGEFVAFPVQLPIPWRWWSGPRWVHIHKARLL
jgi:hypothetical protein